jgi:UDP-glucose 4-epimerase
MKKILITGVAGMIGSHLLDELLPMGYQVIGIDNLSFGKIENIKKHLQKTRFIFYLEDILNRQIMENIGNGVDIIIHLASVKKVGESTSCIPTLDVNAKGTENVLEIARRYGSKVIFASTSDVYGMSTDIPFKEDGDLLLGPGNIKRWGYASAKLYCEQLAFAYYQDYGVPLVVLRYFGGFSPRSSNSWSGGHIPIFLDQIFKNLPIDIHGDGSQTRSMAYVDDLVKGTLLAMENKNAEGEIINLGNDEELSVLESALLIHKMVGNGTELRINFIPMSRVFGNYKDIKRRRPDLTKALSLLGFRPSISFEEGIKKMIAARRGLVREQQKIVPIERYRLENIVDYNEYEQVGR